MCWGGDHVMGMGGAGWRVMTRLAAGSGHKARPRRSFETALRALLRD